MSHVDSADAMPLYDKRTGEVTGRLSAPVSIKDLQPGDVVWDERNDQVAVFDGWSTYSGCYLLHWPDEGSPFDGGFCAWDLDGNGRPSMWRRVLEQHVDDNDSRRS